MVTGEKRIGGIPPARRREEDAGAVSARGFGMAEVVPNLQVPAGKAAEVAMEQNQAQVVAAHELSIRRPRGRPEGQPPPWPPLGYRRAGMVGPSSLLVVGPGGDVS